MTTRVDEGSAAAPPTATQPLTRGQWSVVPQVNLLPEEISAGRRFRGLQKALAGVGIVVALGCVAGVLWAGAGVDEAETDLQAVLAQGADLQRQQAKYAEVPATLAELDRVKAAREAAMGTDVRWYRFLTELAINTPSGTQLKSVSITMNDSTAPTAATVPLSTAGLGTVSVTGTAVNFPDVAAWLEAVNKVTGLTSSTFDSAARKESSGDSGGPAVSGGPEPIEFSGAAVVDPRVLSHVYDRKAS
jgi:Tfp pilus assembly protein PilN